MVSCSFVRLFEQVRECEMEITRFDLLTVYHQIHGRIRTAHFELLTNEKKQRFVVMLRQLSCGSPMNAEKEKSAREILHETKDCMTRLGITEQETVEIVTAMAMGKGHWFKCPKGTRLFIVPMQFSRGHLGLGVSKGDRSPEEIVCILVQICSSYRAMNYSAMRGLAILSVCL